VVALKKERLTAKKVFWKRKVFEHTAQICYFYANCPPFLPLFFKIPTGKLKKVVGKTTERRKKKFRE